MKEDYQYKTPIDFFDRFKSHIDESNYISINKVGILFGSGFKITS